MIEDDMDTMWKILRTGAPYARGGRPRALPVSM